VVGGRTLIPADLCEYQHPAVNKHIGCNRLRCRSCGAWVRFGPPGLVAEKDARPHLAELVAAESWDGLDYLEQRADLYRLYVCQCTAWVESAVYWTDDPDADPMAHASLPWACDGHDVPELPISLRDHELAALADVDETLEKMLRGWSPHGRDGGLYDGPVRWAIWLYTYLLGRPEADALSRQLAERVSDPSPELLGRVLFFFTHFPRASGVEKVIDRASDEIERIAVGCAIPESARSPTLIDVLVARREHRGEPQDTLDRRAADVLRRALLLPLGDLSHEEIGPTEADRYAERMRAGNEALSEEQLAAIESYRRTLQQARGRDLLKGVLEAREHLRAFDADDLRWLADHVDQVERAGPGRWEAVLSLLAAWSRADSDLEHWMVIGAVRLIESELVPVAQVRQWVSDHAGPVDAWALPVTVALDRKARSQIKPVE
jgi:hypothetical protein